MIPVTLLPVVLLRHTYLEKRNAILLQKNDMTSMMNKYKSVLNKVVFTQILILQRTDSSIGLGVRLLWLHITFLDSKNLLIQVISLGIYISHTAPFFLMEPVLNKNRLFMEFN